MTKRNQPTKVVLTMRRKDIRKRKGIRYAEYYNMVEIQDELYRQGMMKKEILPSYADNCQSTKYPTGISQSEK